ncbi:MAG: serine/threonine-protein phosphatase [Candidatus Omnitrophica bacterium]|nr:serine/threonine-protein phosphatase [Candidatus Omnitrophota bacterium]
MYRIVYSQKTDVGRVRENNEDAMLVVKPEGEPERKGILFVIADGLGGLPYGEVASRKSVLLMDRLYRANKAFSDAGWLRRAMEKANAEVYRLNQARPGELPMATTLTASWFRGGELAIGHVGDCRVYRIRAGSLARLTRDHTTDRNTLTRTIGAEEKVEVDLVETPLEAHDTYVQCSDGLYSMVGEEELAETVSRYSPAESCERLTALANRYGGADNVTLQVVRMEKE